MEDLVVEFSPRARRDLQAIYAYLAPRHPDAAKRVAGNLELRILELRRFPLLGQPTEWRNIRALSILNYHVFYTLKGEKARIVHVR